MAKFSLVPALIAVMCLATIADARHNRRHKNDDKNCKKQGDARNYNYERTDLCTEENSELTMDTQSRKRPALVDDNGVKCTCYEAEWLRCNKNGRRRSSTSTTTASSASSSNSSSTRLLISFTSQERASYRENDQCTDYNSVNQSKGCKKKVVPRKNGSCICHEQYWERCEYASNSSNSSSSNSTAL